MSDSDIPKVGWRRAMLMKSTSSGEGNARIMSKVVAM